MCFSASASFVTSGGLAAVSAATAHAAPRRLRFLALIPLAFAVQQALEGINWLTVGRTAFCTATGYGYAFFAFVFWPVFIPASVYAIDRAGRRRVRWFLGLGVAVAFADLVALLVNPLSVSVGSGRLVYDLGIGGIAPWLATIAYVTATCGALFASRIRAFRWFGVLIFAAFLAALGWFPQGFPSVWCYFAAVISATVFLYARRSHR